MIVSAQLYWEIGCHKSLETWSVPEGVFTKMSLTETKPVSTTAAPISAFMEQHFRHFNARETLDAAKQCDADCFNAGIRRLQNAISVFSE